MEDFCFTSARDLAAAVARREVSAREVVEAHLRQIERIRGAIAHA